MVNVEEQTIHTKLEGYKYVSFEEGSHYVQWDGAKCNRCLKIITVRAYFSGALSTFDRIVQHTAKCDCGVKILKHNGIMTLIPRQIFDKEKHNADAQHLTIKDVITVKGQKQRPDNNEVGNNG